MNKKMRAAQRRELSAIAKQVFKIETRYATENPHRMELLEIREKIRNVKDLLEIPAWTHCDFVKGAK